MTLAWILIVASAALLIAALWAPAAFAWNQLRGGPDSERGRSPEPASPKPWLVLAEHQGWQPHGNLPERYSADLILEGVHQGTAFELKLTHRNGPIQPVALFELRVQGPRPRTGLCFEALGERYRICRSGRQLYIERASGARISGLGAFVAAMLRMRGGPLGNALSWDMRLPLDQEGERLVLRGFGRLPEIPQHVETALAMLRAMAQVELLHWQSSADAFESALLFDKGRPRLLVTVGDGPVQAILELRDEGLQTRISAPLELPTPFTIQHAERGEARTTVLLQHPIVDSLLHVRTAHPAELRALLEHAPVLEGVMAICHGYPGSTVTNRSIDLRAPGELGSGLSAAMLLVGELAQIFSALGAR